MNEGLPDRTWSDFRAHWRPALAFHVLMQLLWVAIFTPLITWIGRRILRASGEPLISNYDMAAFVLSPTGIVFVLVIVALTVSLLLGEFAGLSWIAGQAIVRRRVTATSALARVLGLLPRLVTVSARVFLRLVVLTLPFLAAAVLVWFTMLAGHDINYYLDEHPPEWRRAHAAGKDVHVWTVNAPEVMVRMIERGVDNIITDDPALLARVMERRKALRTPELLGLRLRVLFDIPPRELRDPDAVKPL